MDDLEVLLGSLALDEAGLYRQWLSLGSVLNILLALVFGFAILALYHHLAPKGKEDRNLYTVLPVLTVLMALLMRVDGAPAAFFFGVFGVLSIIRFRSDLTDQTGITFILFAVIQGILLGAGNYLLALAGFVLVGGAIAVGRRFHQRSRLFKVTVKTAAGLPETRARLEAWFAAQGFGWRAAGLTASIELAKGAAERGPRRRLDYELTLPAARSAEEPQLAEAWMSLLEETGWDGELKAGES